MFDNGSYLRRRRRFKRTGAEKRMKRAEDCKEENKETLEEGEINNPSNSHSQGHGHSQSESGGGGNMVNGGGPSSSSSSSSHNAGVSNHNTNAACSPGEVSASVKTEKDISRRGMGSPGEITRNTKMEPMEAPHSDCLGGSTVDNHHPHHAISDRRLGGVTPGMTSPHSSHTLAHSQIHHGAHPGVLGQGLSSCSSLNLSNDGGMSSIDGSGHANSFSVENFLSPSHLSSHSQADLSGASVSSAGLRPPALVSSHPLPFSRQTASDLYRPGTACSQAPSPPTPSAYNYHCRGGGTSTPQSSLAYPTHGGHGSHLQHGLMNMSTSGVAGHHTAATAANGNANNPTNAVNGGSNAACSDDSATSSPHGTPHHHSNHSSHLSPHSLQQHNGLFSHMAGQTKDFYPRSNSWYMNPTDLNSGPSDFSSFPSVFPTHSSCQLAAFPSSSYKASSSYYDCTKF